MTKGIKKLVLKRTVFWIISSLFFSTMIFIFSGSIFAALVVGFAFFFYSLSAIYIYYQYINREGENK